MTRFRLRWSVVTITSALTAVIVISLLIASGIALYSSYKFDLDLAKRNEYIISSSLQKGGLPFAVATQDLELIKSIINSHLQYRELFAIEIADSNGNLIYRNEKQLKDSAVKITPQKFDIISPYKDISLSGLDSMDTEFPPTLGTVTIYYSTELLEEIVLNQAISAGAILLCAIASISFLLYLFNRLISKHLAITIRMMESIEKGERLQWDDKHVPSLRELRVIYHSLRHLSTTIFERDTRLKESLQDALDAKAAAQQAEHFKDDFIRAISHDIRTPVGVVVNLLSIIRQESSRYELGSSLADKLNACYQSAKVLNDVTNELFDLEQFQRMELIEHRESVDLEDLFNRIGAMYERKFVKKRLSFSVSRDDAQPPGSRSRVCLDKRKVTLVVENIVDNALKFTKTGSVTVQWSIQKDYVEIKIRDSGIGIPEDKFEVIFDQHTQLQDPVTSYHQGRGLGLFYVKRLLDAIGAEIDVSSKVGIGSIFHIKVPFTVAVEADAPALPSPSTSAMKDEQAGTPENSLSVLVIDDDEATCFTLKEMLAQHGIQCVTENIPEIGYNRLINEAPDLVFIDYHMTGLSGDKLAQKALSILAPNATFFVCITAESNLNSIAMLNEIFQEVYRKPFEAGRLKEILENVSKSKRVTNSILSTFKCM